MLLMTHLCALLTTAHLLAVLNGRNLVTNVERQKLCEIQRIDVMSTYAFHATTQTVFYMLEQQSSSEHW
jgi:hypothetical protein